MSLPADGRAAMVGRDREQTELATAPAGALAGHGRAVLVLGEAGMGKSMPADWLVGEAERAGMRVARGACSAAGMPPTVRASRTASWASATLAASGSETASASDSLMRTSADAPL
jgi:AAA ATPase domain